MKPEEKIERAYEELRAIIDGGSESFTHEDAVQYLKDKLSQPAVAEQHKQEPVELNKSGIRKLLKQSGFDNSTPEETAAFISGIRHREAEILDTTPPQRKPLTDEQIEAAAKKLAQCFDYPWEHMIEKGRENMRLNAQAVIEAAHGIKE